MSAERSPLQERLTAAVDAVTPEVDVDGVVRRIDHRRVERRRVELRQRRARRALASAALAAACVAGVVVVTTRSTQDLRTVDAADPGPGARVPAQPDPDEPPTGSGVTPEIGSVNLPGSGSRATAVAVAADGVWVARGSALDAARSGPDTVTWIGHDGAVGPSTEVRGVALMGVADDNHLWFLVREATDLTAPGALRLKQVERATGELLASHDVPLGEPPVGVGLEGTNLWVQGAARELLLDRTGAVVEDRPVDGQRVPEQNLASAAELAGLDPGESVVGADGDHLWVLRGTTLRPLPRER